MHRASGPIRAAVLLFLLAVVAAPPQVAAEAFPHYDVIRPNVSFWTDIYTRYTSREAIIHDSRDLNIVYEVIDLKMPYDAPGKRKIHRRRIKRIKARYRNILRQLAADPHTRNPECRRVAELFGPGAGKREFRLASRQVRSQIGQRDRFQAGLVRSGAFIDEIRSIFASYDLPVELAYLPHVESSFNPKAYSKFGAAGIWQFTRSTGRRFMQVDYVLDERRDPIQATHAAARLLKENYEKLHSWPLAVTAYNHGAAGMLRAKQAHGKYPEIYSHYRSRTFKFASRNFYSEFLAASRIAADYRTYFGDLRLDRPANHQSVTLAGYAPFKDLSRHYGVSPDLLAAMNPALRPPVFNGQKYVPKGYALRLPRNLDIKRPELASLSSDLFHEKQKPSRFYTVQRGDTAGKIARMHGVNLASLALANNLNRRATIYPKQTLRIPLPGRERPAETGSPEPKPAESLVASREPSEKKVTLADPVEDSYPQPVLAAIIPSPAAPKEPTVEVTEKSSTTAEPASAEVVSADVRFTKIVHRSSGSVGILRVEVEETLGHYAEWANVRTQSIRRLNGLAFGRTLHLHQRIEIPLNKVSARIFEEQRYEFHKRLQEDFFAVYRTNNLQAYQVHRGDNYWTLCRDKFDVPLWLLQNSNPEIDFASLKIDQKLWIPIVEKISSEDAAEDPDESDAFDATEEEGPADTDDDIPSVDSPDPDPASLFVGAPI